MEKRSCCFTGHRIIRSVDLPTLADSVKAEIRKLCADGVTNFISGGARGFDLFAANAVLELRDELGITLELFLPCRDQDVKWHAAEREIYAEVLAAADSVSYIGEKYDEGCMNRRNRAMVDASEHCIVYMYRSFGGTAKTVKYLVETDTPMTLLV